MSERSMLEAPQMQPGPRGRTSFPQAHATLPSSRVHPYGGHSSKTLSTKKTMCAVQNSDVREINPHQRCRCSDSPFARVHYFYTAGSENGLEVVDNRGTNKLYPRKRHLFVIGKYFEDVKQDEKSVPDLLESIMRPTCFVKEELWRILIKPIQFSPK